jgi:hypothetical protein
MREKTQISKMRNEKWEITANTKKMQGIIRDYFDVHLQDGQISRYLGPSKSEPRRF